MISRKIPRWGQCGIFSIRPWRTLPVGALFLSLKLFGQTMPLLVPPDRESSTSIASSGATKDLTTLVLRIAFASDEDLSTTGDGTFLMDINSLDIDSVRCDGFLVDPPPHDVPYFYAQLEAAANYYQQVSRDSVTFDLAGSLVYPPDGEDPIVLGKPMAGYRPVVDEDSSDALLVALFAESLLAATNSGVSVMDYDLVVIFHAGLGQDFVYPALDPTPNDIPSAYIDEAMIADARDKYGVPVPPYVKGGLLLPEGQNHIYYDIVEDVFPGETDYCDMQIGLTGTFALLLGYALGLPPLYETDDGVTGVGVFGLMDVGSNNGQGVIPAPPTAWTRILLGWEEAEELEGNCSLTARHLPAGKIGRITLSNSEYFLVENRVGPVQPETGIDFDDLVELAGVSVDSVSGVITSIPNYDLGLPGSGLLIWHIDTSYYKEGMQGINDSLEARAVALVEADGAVDIGFPTTALFGNPDLGWQWDLWYAGNEAFFTANPDREIGNPQGLLSFDNETHPSTKLNSGAESGIAVSRIGPAGDILDFVVDDINVTRLPEESRLLGFDGINWVYEQGDSIWLDGMPIGELTSGSNLIVMVSEHDAPHMLAGVARIDLGFWIIDQGEGRYRARRFRNDGTIQVDLYADVVSEGAYYDNGILWIITDEIPPPSSPDTTHIAYIAISEMVSSWGFLNNDTSRAPVVQGPIDPAIDLLPSSILWNLDDYLSLGDVDGDGLDEIIAVDRPDALTRSYRLTVVNANGTALDGFPLSGDFQSPVFITNLEGDIRPELVVVESGDIAVYSPEGQQITRLGLHTDPSDIFLMNTAGDSVGLANGDRINWFDPDEPNPQWVTSQGRHSRCRYSLNYGEPTVPQPAILDKARVYNYPNPVIEGRTTIRFYTGTASRATIRIYTVDGLPVSKEEITDLAVNDYNEWVWEVGDNPSGLYYAVVEVEGSEKATALVKIAVIR
ncbi:MAG: hypothetical protein JSU77_08580 [Fidelibacterota bacterium]|nr:MAG: hypothetical protein JSU77_08580 [Candidatus Neomarinimicrobiota bacterium]